MIMENSVTAADNPEISMNDETKKVPESLEEAIRFWSGDPHRKGAKMSTQHGPTLPLAWPAPSRELKNSTNFIFEVRDIDFSGVANRYIKKKFAECGRQITSWLLHESNVRDWLNSLDGESFFRRKSALNLLKTLRYSLVPIATEVGRTPDGLKLLIEFLNHLDQYFEHFCEFWVITDLDTDFLDQIPFVPEVSFFKCMRNIILAFISEKSLFESEEPEFETQEPNFKVQVLWETIKKCQEILGLLYANFDANLPEDNPVGDSEDSPAFLERVQEFAESLELFEERVKTLQFCRGQGEPPEVFCCDTYMEFCKDLLNMMPVYYLSAFSHLQIHIESLAEKVRAGLRFKENLQIPSSDLGTLDFQVLKDEDLACSMWCKECGSEKISEIAQKWAIYWWAEKEKNIFSRENPETSEFIEILAKVSKEIVFCINRFSARNEQYHREPKLVEETEFDYEPFERNQAEAEVPENPQTEVTGSEEGKEPAGNSGPDEEQEMLAKSANLQNTVKLVEKVEPEMPPEVEPEVKNVPEEVVVVGSLEEIDEKKVNGTICNNHQEGGKMEIDRCEWGIKGEPPIKMMKIEVVYPGNNGMEPCESQRLQPAHVATEGEGQQEEGEGRVHQESATDQTPIDDES